MLHPAIGAMAHAEASPRTLACTSDGVWLWPATPLTERRGSGLVPVPTPLLFAQVAALHGPCVHIAGLERALHAAVPHLDAGRIADAETVLATLALPPVTLQGGAVMKAVARRLGIACPGVTVAGPPLAPSGDVVLALAQVHDRKLAEARRLESAFNPALRRVAPANAPFDPALHPRWPEGRPDGGQFRPREGGDDAGAIVPVAARDVERVRLPPGQKGRPELKDLIERIANATPDEIMDLHREIEARYGRYGDIPAAAMLHQAVSEATESDVTPAERQRILDEIAFLADRSPENVATLNDMLGALIGARGAGRGEAEELGYSPPRGAGFRSRELLKEHFDDHGSDFGAGSMAEYEAQAEAFMTGPPKAGTLEKIRSRDGALVRYNRFTDEFGVLDPKTNTIRTYYKPDPRIHKQPTNLDYYNSQ